MRQVAGLGGSSFRRDAGLFATDRFHPNARGYATWIPVLDDALLDDHTGRLE